MTLGQFIIQYRKEHGDMSQRAFAKQCGLSPTYIRVLETGRNTNGSVTTPSIETYNIIAKGVGISFDELISAVNDDVVVNPTFTVKEQSLIFLYRKANDRDKELIDRILESYEEDTTATFISSKAAV